MRRVIALRESRRPAQVFLVYVGEASVVIHLPNQGCHVTIIDGRLHQFCNHPALYDFEVTLFRLSQRDNTESKSRTACRRESSHRTFSRGVLWRSFADILPQPGMALRPDAAV
jgi:hypothetical protein